MMAHQSTVMEKLTSHSHANICGHVSADARPMRTLYCQHWAVSGQTVRILFIVTLNGWPGGIILWDIQSR